MVGNDWEEVRRCDEDDADEEFAARDDKCLGDANGDAVDRALWREDEEFADVDSRSKRRPKSWTRASKRRMRSWKTASASSEKELSYMATRGKEKRSQK